jgi:hypothetical protein
MEAGARGATARRRDGCRGGREGRDRREVVERVAVLFGRLVRGARRSVTLVTAVYGASRRAGGLGPERRVVEEEVPDASRATADAPDARRRRPYGPRNYII